MENDNPLLKFNGLPCFDEIEIRHIEPALDYMLDRNRKQIESLVENADTPTWENLMEPMEELSDRLEKLWAPVSHLNAVKDSEELREIYDACLAKITDYATELGQNRGLFSRIRQLHESEAYAALDQARRRTVENDLRDSRLSGIELDGEAKVRFREISARLSDLANRFSKNLLDATDAWQMHITDEGDLAGLPRSVINLGRQVARQQGHKGWIFTLKAPCYLPFMSYSENRDLREEMYRANVTRASEIGPHAGKWDNAGIICETLELRREMASLLGYRDYAAYALEKRMAGSAEEVAGFLRDLARRCREAALADMDELGEFAQRCLGLQSLEAWDIPWASEKLKEEKYDFSEEALRPYFPLPKVLSGMFDVVGELFGVRVERDDTDRIWHPDVQFFRISDRDNRTRGFFYTDLFARERKRSGAWMGECVNRRRTGEEVQLPAAFITCNFPEPVDNKPSLLSHEEVLTLFHEFGHGLHHLLTSIDVASVSGINGVPWDAVELPSQFLENWCWQRESLDRISGHYRSGGPIPDDLFSKMQASRNFQSAMRMLRQVEFSLFDLEIHRESADISSPQSVREILARVRKEVAVVPTPEFNRFENGFSHIFAGGYAAGYYSYKWAEVLSSDAFSLFEENGIFDRDTGQSFLHNILEKGGSEDPMRLFADFRGRKPRVDALLRHSGLSLGDDGA